MAFRHVSRALAVSRLAGQSRGLGAAAFSSRRPFSSKKDGADDEVGPDDYAVSAKDRRALGGRTGLSPSTQRLLERFRAAEVDETDEGAKDLRDSEDSEDAEDPMMDDEDTAEQDSREIKEYKKERATVDELLYRPSYKDAADHAKRYSKDYVSRFYIKDDKRTPPLKERYNSPEADPRDPTNMWAKFSREDMYKLLSHHRQSNRMGYLEYQNIYNYAIDEHLNELRQNTQEEQLKDEDFMPPEMSVEDDAEGYSEDEDIRGGDEDIRPADMFLREGLKDSDLEGMSEEEKRYARKIMGPAPSRAEEEGKMWSDLNDLETRLKREEAAPGSDKTLSVYSPEQRARMLAKIARTKERLGDAPAKLAVEAGGVYTEEQRAAMKPTKAQLSKDLKKNEEEYKGGLTDDEDDEVVRHIQWFRPKQVYGRVLNQEDDDIGDRIAMNRDLRLNPDAYAKQSLEQYVQTLPEGYRRRFASTLDDMIAQADEARVRNEATRAQSPAQIPSAEYGVQPNKFKSEMGRNETPQTKRLFPRANVATTFDEWTRTIETQALLRELGVETLPQQAAEALRRQWQKLDMDRYTVEPLIADAPADPSDPKTVCEYQQRMIDVYGEAFEYRERYEARLDEHSQAILDRLVASAVPYREIDPRVYKKAEKTELEQLQDLEAGKKDYDALAKEIVEMRSRFFYDGTDVYGYLNRKFAERRYLEEQLEALKEAQLQDSDDEPEEPLANKPEREGFDFSDWNETYTDMEYRKLDYKHSDVADEALMAKLDPDEDVYDQPDDPASDFPEVLSIHPDVKKAMFRLNQVDPIKYHSRKLSQMFKLQLARVQAILILEYHEAQIEQKYKSIAGGGWSEVYFEMEITDDEDLEDPAFANRGVKEAESGNDNMLEEEGEDGLSMQRGFGEEEEGEGKGFDVDDSVMYAHTKRLIGGAELQEAVYGMDRPTVSQWDPEIVRNVAKNADSRFVDESDLFLLKQLEKRRKGRFWDKEETRMRQERENSLLNNKSPFGAPGSDEMGNRIALLSRKKQSKGRYSYLLTDISNIKDAEFSIAVRDTNGSLREATEREFMWVRRREKHKKAFFKYKPYPPFEGGPAGAKFKHRRLPTPKKGQALMAMEASK